MSFGETIDYDFPPDAQKELAEFLESKLSQEMGENSQKRARLARLVQRGEGEIVVPKHVMNTVSWQLAQLGI